MLHSTQQRCADDQLQVMQCHMIECMVIVQTMNFESCKPYFDDQQPDISDNRTITCPSSKVTKQGITKPTVRKSFVLWTTFECGTGLICKVGSKIYEIKHGNQSEAVKVASRHKSLVSPLSAQGFKCVWNTHDQAASSPLILSAVPSAKPTRNRADNGFRACHSARPMTTGHDMENTAEKMLQRWTCRSQLSQVIIFKSPNVLALLKSQEAYISEGSRD